MSRTEARRAALRILGALAVTFSSFSARAGEGGPRPLWSFHAGAPLSGPPGVGADGSLAFGTVDGYVHSLRADGTFRYSYTVDGRVLSSPVVLDDGLVLVASDKNRLYAIRPDGSLGWESNVAGGVTSPLAVDTQGRIWLRTGSGTAIAMSRRGGVVGFAKIGRTMTLGPTPLADGFVLVGSPAGELGVIGEFGRFRRLSVEPTLVGLWALAPGFLALASGTLSAFGSDLRVVWTRNEVSELLCTAPLVTVEAGEVHWLAADGGVAARAPAVGAVTGPSACTPSAVFALDGRGALVQFRRTGESSRIDATAGALVALDASRAGSLVLAYRDGRVVAVKVVS